MSEDSRNCGGAWTEQKLKILREYMDSYTTALKSAPFRLIYVDAFAGSGRHKMPDAEMQRLGERPSLFAQLGDGYAEMAELHKGSAALALEIENKAFNHFRFIDNDPECVKSLEEKLMQKHPSRDSEV